MALLKLYMAVAPVQFNDSTHVIVSLASRLGLPGESDARDLS